MHHINKCVAIPICRPFCSKQFYFRTFFRISYSLTGKQNLNINFFQVLTYYNIPNFGLIEKCYEGNQQRLVCTIGNKYCKSKFFQTVFLKKNKKCSYFDHFCRMWLVNELVFTFSAPIKYAKAQFNPIIASRVIEYSIYDENVRSNDFHVRGIY